MVSTLSTVILTPDVAALAFAVWAKQKPLAAKIMASIKMGLCRLFILIQVQPRCMVECLKLILNRLIALHRMWPEQSYLDFQSYYSSVICRTSKFFPLQF